MTTTVIAAEQRRVDWVKFPNRRIINLSVFFVCTLYLAMSPPVFYHLLEFYPLKCAVENYPQSETGVKRDDVWFKTATGTKLHGWYFPCENARRTVIIHHGQGGNITTYTTTALTLLKAGCSVLLYDYSGFGASEGSPSNEALRQDSEAAYDYIVRERGVAPANVVHCGVSLGSGPAAELACRKPCAGIVLLSPYLSLRSIAQRMIPFLRLYPAALYPQPDFGASVLFGKKLPILLIHAEGDPILPIESSEEIYKRSQGPKTFIRVPGRIHIGGLSCQPGEPGDTSAVQVYQQFLKVLD